MVKLQRVKKTAIILLSIFLLVFGLRLVFQLNAEEPKVEISFVGNTRNMIAYDMAVGSSSNKMKQNYASSRTVVTGEMTQKTITVEQKYERVGNVNSQTGNFEEDKKKVMDYIKESMAIVQFENNSGTNGNMFLELHIGVHPDKFDGFVEKMKRVGSLTDFRVDKVDKTSEYKDLNARKMTLEKAKESFVKLKEKGGSINDLINLENKIIEIDEKIQDLGVTLGDFSEENELCTVKYTLTENKGLFDKSKMTFGKLVSIALQAFGWTIKYYLLVLLIISMCGLASYLVLLAVDKGIKIYKNNFANEEK